MTDSGEWNFNGVFSVNSGAVLGAFVACCVTAGVVGVAFLSGVEVFVFCSIF